MKVQIYNFMLERKIADNMITNCDVKKTKFSCAETTHSRRRPNRFSPSILLASIVAAVVRKLLALSSACLASHRRKDMNALGASLIFQLEDPLTQFGVRRYNRFKLILTELISNAVCKCVVHNGSFLIRRKVHRISMYFLHS